MKLKGRAWQPLDYLSETPWLETLTGFTFHLTHESYATEYDTEHLGLAFFLLMRNGLLATRFQAQDSFDALPIPGAYFQQERLHRLMRAWIEFHERYYGSGTVLKMGLYCFAPGGRCGYHVDGPVKLEGLSLPLTDPHTQNQVIQAHTSHRTIFPLQLNAEDEFWIGQHRIRTTPGLLFEFDNMLPHAFYNKGSQHTILLVTTYRAEAELFRPSLVDPYAYS